MKTKKASLSLSINAIVILVLALTMLGLGISFTKNMFGKLGEQVLAKADYKEVPNPTEDEPVTTLDTITVKAGSSAAVPLKILNYLTSSITIDNIDIQCGGDGVVDTTNSKYILPNNGLTIQPGRIGKAGVKLSIKGSASKGQEDLCTFTVTNNGNTYSESTTISVKVK